MIFSDDDKRVVDQYKQTNIALRKQLNNLNNEIDKLLQKHSNKVGLQKMPEVQKKITDPKILQYEVENLRKRVQLLERDQENFAEKAKHNYHQMIKQNEARIQQQEIESQDIKRMIKQYERKDKIADVIASKEDKNKTWEKRISLLQQELARTQKIQKQLAKELSIQAVSQTKATNHLHEIANKHHETIVKIQKQRRKSAEKSSKRKPPISPNKDLGGPSEQKWKQLKIQFLTFKETKQNEQTALNIENEQLRNEMKEWKKKIKEKEQRIAVIKLNEQKNRIRAKNYSTLQESKVRNSGEKYRYRDRNNSINYNTRQ